MKRRLSFAVRDQLAGRIASGEIEAGSRLPPEPQLAADLGVSRATLREALRSLEEDGLVTRTRGAGTYATSRPRLRNNLDINFGVSEAIRAAGMRPGTASTAVRTAAASPEEARALDLVAGDTVVVLERVRTADDRPVVWSRDVVRATLLPAGALEPAGDVSVYDVLARNDVAVQHGVVTVEPQVADKALAKRLRIEPGALILYLRQVDYDASGEPVLLSHEHHVADAFEFSVVRRGPGGGAR
ncbi:MAG TPA: GntR family transcriptional regulator [Actinomycetota bacterium]|jgi:DNA-binding GntR family transcriptional regulator